MKNGLGFCVVMILSIGAWGSISVPAMADPNPEAGIEPRLSQFSGKPVPRFESLRYSTVNGRTGPSLEHPIAWRYERAGLPVMIVKECPDWRRIRDPEGAEVWIHARMLSPSSTAIVNRDVSLKRKAEVGAEDVAILQAGVIVEVIDENNGMVKVRKDRLLGWIDRGGIWGDPASSGS